MTTAAPYITEADVADAVVAELGAQDYAVAFTPERRDLPTYDVKDLADGVVRVAVVGAGHASERIDRDTTRHTFTVHVGVTAKLTDDTNASIGPMIAVTNEVRRSLIDAPLAALPSVNFDDVEPAATYDPTQLRRNRVFMSVIPITYRIAE